MKRLREIDESLNDPRFTELDLVENDVARIIQDGELEGYKHNNVIAEERMERLTKQRINDIDRAINELHQNTVEVDMGGSVFAYIL